MQPGCFVGPVASPLESREGSEAAQRAVSCQRADAMETSSGLGFVSGRGGNAGLPGNLGQDPPEADKPAGGGQAREGAGN